MDSSIFFALYAGLAWALGQFGRSFSVAEQNMSLVLTKSDMILNSHTQFAIDSYVSLIYVSGCCSIGLLASLSNMHSAHHVMEHDMWRQRILVTMGLGVVEGLGSLLSVVVIGYAARHSMTTIAPVIMNGALAVCAPLMVAFFFQEKLSIFFWMAIPCVLLGIIMASDLTLITELKEEGQVSTSVRITIGSICVALCWSCGVLGNRYIMAKVPLGLEAEWASVSYTFAVFPMLLSPLISIAASAFGGPGSRVDQHKVVHVVTKCRNACFGCGMITGTGGLSLQFALSDRRLMTAGLVALSKGMYNISSALLFKIVYREKLRVSQSVGITMLLVGIGLAGMTD
eukprot:TRINITY_DN72500_c0_g1_i1.p1 TRINITY_DN72500_c0_g1~~TRINITY_DN72500_c0_g1_i1.p1  ORF type:complete len:342 (+),score=41.77 TRINITY_DN72500_c0_g1_i1:70-1095(+)